MVSSGGIAVLAVAIVLLLGLKRLIGGVDSGIFVALLLVPIAVYSLLSGKIQELSGGGLALGFKDFAQASVASTSIKKRHHGRGSNAAARHQGRTGQP